MRDDNKLHREKRYVEVDVRFIPDGKIRPLAINYDKSYIYGLFYRFGLIDVPDKVKEKMGVKEY